MKDRNKWNGEKEEGRRIVWITEGNEEGARMNEEEEEINKAKKDG